MIRIKFPVHCCLVTKLQHQLLPNSKAAAKAATKRLNSWVDFQTKSKMIRIKF